VGAHLGDEGCEARCRWGGVCRCARRMSQA